MSPETLTFWHKGPLYETGPLLANYQQTSIVLQSNCLIILIVNTTQTNMGLMEAPEGLGPRGHGSALPSQQSLLFIVLNVIYIILKILNHVLNRLVTCNQPTANISQLPSEGAASKRSSFYTDNEVKRHGSWFTTHLPRAANFTSGQQ